MTRVYSFIKICKIDGGNRCIFSPPCFSTFRGNCIFQNINFLFLLINFIIFYHIIILIFTHKLKFEEFCCNMVSTITDFTLVIKYCIHKSCLCNSWCYFTFTDGFNNFLWGRWLSQCSTRDRARRWLVSETKFCPGFKHCFSRKWRFQWGTGNKSQWWHSNRCFLSNVYNHSEHKSFVKVLVFYRAGNRNFCLCRSLYFMNLQGSAVHFFNRAQCSTRLL